MLFNHRISRCGKKKDELEATPSSTPLVSLKSAPENIVQTTSKPAVSFSDLKLKAEFSLNEAKATYSTASSSIHNSAKEEIAQENEPFTLEQLQAAVTNFSQQKQASGNRQLYTTLTESKITLKEDNTIELVIHNEVQNEMLSSVKQHLVDSLRKELKNNTINITITVQEITAQTKAYKPTDKFKLLAEKNPTLLELKKRFDLDIEY